MKIADFFVQLGVKADTFTVREFGNSIGNLPLYAAGAITALAGLNLGAVAMTGHMLDLSNSLGIFRAETGLSTDEIQRWQNAAKQVGVSAESVTSSFKGIADAQVRLRFGDAGVAVAAGRLGIGTGFLEKSPNEIVKQLREVYKTMDPNQFRMFSSGIGVSSEMMRMFELSNADFNRAMSVGPTLGGGDMKVLAEFQGEIGRFAKTIEQAFVPVIREITPHLGALARSIGELVRALAPAAGKATGLLTSGIDAINKIASIDVNAPLKDVPFSESLLGKAWRELGEKLEKMDAQTKQVTVNQHIYGVDDAEEAGRASAEHLKSELRRSSKTVNRGY